MSLLPPLLRPLGFQKTRDPTARAWIQVDREALAHNVHQLESLLPQGCQLMPAVKANAYGHGAALVTRELNRLGIHNFCVATALEGAELRRQGITGEILVLGYTHPTHFPLLSQYRLTQAVLDPSYAGFLEEYGKSLSVHLKLDTGMHRLGQRAEEWEKLLPIFRYKHLKVTGVFTHLAASEDPSPRAREFTIAQGKAFYQTVAQLEKHGCSCGKTHLLASGGLLYYPQLGGSYARVGIALYGVLSTREELASCPVALKPVLSLKARVAQVKEVYPGETVGYGLGWAAPRRLRIAILSIGYADGVPRALSNGRGTVLLHHRKAPIVGAVCMDQLMVDITKIPQTSPGDIATLLGKDGAEKITAYDMAEAAGTITNEILSRLGARLERIQTKTDTHKY